MTPTRDDARWLQGLAERDDSTPVRFAELVEKGFTAPTREELRALLDAGCEFLLRDEILFVTPRSFFVASFRIAAKQGRQHVH